MVHVISVANGAVSLTDSLCANRFSERPLQLQAAQNMTSKVRHASANTATAASSMPHRVTGNMHPIPCHQAATKDIMHQQSSHVPVRPQAAFLLRVIHKTQTRCALPAARGHTSRRLPNRPHAGFMTNWRAMSPLDPRSLALPTTADSKPPCCSVSEPRRAQLPS